MEAVNYPESSQPSSDETLILRSAPKSLADAVETLVAALTPMERDLIQRMTRKTAQLGLGFLARQHWNLSDPGSPLVHWFVEHCGVSHAQDISALLMEATWAKVHGEPAQTQELAIQIQSEWRQLGHDPRAATLLPK